MYGAQFCKVYNEFGWNYFPEAFGRQLLQWLQVQGIIIHDALDLGCGTGILCGVLSQSGVRTIGTDISPDMIEIARLNYPELSFEVADMTSYVPDQFFDLVTCTGDALNHLKDLDAITCVFRNVFSMLRPHGYFVFDVLSGREIGDGAPIDLDYDEHTSACFQISRHEDQLVQLSVSVSQDGLPAFRETVTERIYAPDEILQLLKEAGFTAIEQKDRMLAMDAPGASWYFTARKPN